jgi:hypothetical protein
VSDTTYQADPRYKRKPSRLICHDALLIVVNFFAKLWEDVAKWKDFMNTGPSPREIIAKDGTLNSAIKMPDAFRKRIREPEIHHDEDYIVKFGQDWTDFIDEWDNKNDRSKNKESILLRVMQLNTDSTVVFKKYKAALIAAWPVACKRTKERAADIWTRLQTINDPNLPAADFEFHCKQIAVDVKQIEFLNPYLRCFHDSPALRFAETYWPETCYYLTNEKWTDATRMYVNYINIIIPTLDPKSKRALRPSDHFSKGLSNFR